MRVFLKCVAEAIAEKGAGGIASLVPGGKIALDVASAALKKYRERKRDAEIRAEVQQLAAASFEDARRVAAEVAREAVANGPIEDRITLELYLARVPGTVRESLRRPDDPTGNTVPRSYALRTSDDLSRMLPREALRFKPHDPIPRLPDWHLVELLGAGGFGEVWLARHRTAPESRGAIKFCHGHRASDLQHERELIARVMRAGPHPNIVSLRGANLEGATPWLLYEYVPGPDLGAWVQQLRAQPTGERVNQAVLALRQLCPAVAHFHRLRPAIVHRDLKPNNILVDRVSKRLRITDFGIGAVAAKTARTEVGDGTTTRHGKFPDALRGAYTSLYASPQQRDGGPADPRDDVHALGVIAYQLLTGQLGHGPGTDFGDDLRAVGVSPALIDLIGECVARNPARRPRDADELFRRVRALPAALIDEVTVTTPPPFARVPSPEPLSGFVRCTCCDLPIPVTTDDVGLTVTCLRTRKLIPVKGVDHRGRATPTPIQSDRAPAPPVPTRDSGSLPGEPVATGSLPAPEPAPGESDEPDDYVPQRHRKRRGAPLALVGGLGLVVALALGGVLWKLIRTDPATAMPESANRPNNVPSVSPNRAPVPEPRDTPSRKTGIGGLVVSGGSPPASPDSKIDSTVVTAAGAVSDLGLRAAIEARLEHCTGASREPDAAVRRQAAEALASFLTDPDERLRLRAAKALEEMGADAEFAAPGLRAATADPRADVRRAARTALEKIDEAVSLAKAAQVREAIRLLAKDLKAKESAKRIKALKQIGAYGPDASTVGEQLIEALVDKVPGVQVAASEALEKINPSVHPHVFTLLFGMNKGGAVRQLEQLGHQAAIAVPLLLFQLNDSHLPRDTITNEEVNLFVAIAKIAPKDRRFAAVVLATIAAPIPPAEAGNIRMGRPTRGETRLAALAQLNTIEADTVDKVKALSAALGDEVRILYVIAALEGLGGDAAPALPVLKKLKTSPDDAIRNAAIKALKRIE